MQKLQTLNVLKASSKNSSGNFMKEISTTNTGKLHVYFFIFSRYNLFIFDHVELQRYIETKLQSKAILD